MKVANSKILFYRKVLIIMGNIFHKKIVLPPKKLPNSQNRPFWGLFRGFKLTFIFFTIKVSKNPMKNVI